MTTEENKTPTAPAEETASAPAPAPEPAPAPAPETKTADASAEVEVPAKFKKIVEEIEKMSVLELNELVKVFENKFGVSAQAVAAAAPGAGASAGEEEKSTVNVELADGGANKISVIKVVKEVLGLGLKEAKDLVDAVPSMLKTDMKKEEAEELKKRIEEAGGKINFK